MSKLKRKRKKKRANYALKKIKLFKFIKLLIRYSFWSDPKNRLA